MSFTQRKFAIIILCAFFVVILVTPTLAQNNAYHFDQAIESGLISYQLQGQQDPNEAHVFYGQGPQMLLTLTNNTADTLVIEVDTGLIVQPDDVGFSKAVIIPAQEKIELPAQAISEVNIYAYTLDYTNGKFPSSDTFYHPENLVSIEVRRLLDNIQALDAEVEFSSQLAVWIVNEGQQFEYWKDIEREIPGADFDPLVPRLKQILEGEVGPSGLELWSWNTLIGVVCLLVLVCILLLFLVTRFLGNQKIINQLEDWQVYKEQGGQGKAWIPKHRLLQQRVLVKLPKQETRRAFKKEQKIHGKLKHLNIVPFLEAGKGNIHDKTQLYLILKYVQGCSLDELLKSKYKDYIRGNRPLINEITLQFLDALEYTHDQSIIHRDLKIDHLIIDVTGRLFLIDFGIATQLNDVDKKPSGTPDYMLNKREQERLGNKAVPAYDFYMVGIIIYSLYMGEDKTQDETKRALKTSGVIPENLRLVLRKCLLLENDEYKNVSELRMALDIERRNVNERQKEIEQLSKMVLSLKLTALHRPPTATG